MWSLKEMKTKGDVYHYGYLVFHDINSPTNLMYLIPKIGQCCPDFVSIPFSAYGDCRLGCSFLIKRSISGYINVNTSYFLYISNKSFDNLSILVELHRLKRNMKEGKAPEGSSLFWTTIEMYFPSGIPILKTTWAYSIDTDFNCYFISLKNELK